MHKTIKVFFVFVPILLAFSGCATSVNSVYQKDADLIRLEHLEYWSGLIEEYYSKNNSYPLQDRVSSEDETILVKIVTRQQAKKMKSYMSQLNSALMIDFVEELESGLEREIDEKYDVQKVPVKSPIGYYYFATKKGYLLWVPCITCGVTKISTLLMDGVTPTVNITSPDMKDEVTKALTRDEMLGHPIYKSWVNKQFNKEGYVRDIVDSNLRDSKKKLNDNAQKNPIVDKPAIFKGYSSSILSNFTIPIVGTSIVNDIDLKIKSVNGKKTWNILTGYASKVELTEGSNSVEIICYGKYRGISYEEKVQLIKIDAERGITYQLNPTEDGEPCNFVISEVDDN